MAKNRKEIEALKARLIEDLHKYSKAADRRLRRLEAKAGDPYYKDILKWAYKDAQRDIRHFYGSKANRFDHKLSPNMSVKQLQARLNAVRRFLDSPTSLIKGYTDKSGVRHHGITDIYIKRAKTFNNHYGTNFTWEEFAYFMENKYLEKMSRKLGSKAAMKRLGQFKSVKDQVIKDLTKSGKRNKKLSTKKVMDEVYKRLIKNGVSKEDL